MRGAAFIAGGGQHPTVSIDKAENGYMVTLQPALDGMMDAWIGPGGGEFPDPERLKQLRIEQEKYRSKTFVFDDIEKAWTAIKEFLLDGRMPRGSVH